jgi:geranylgeranyl diphosphate synthase type II
MTSFDLASWSRSCQTEFDAWLSDQLEPAWPASFVEPMRYPVFGGGKRMRPLFTFAACEALGTLRAAALPAAAAVELVHTYSLVHDDLPAMDDDDERRGRPTVHIAFTEASAILAGDALLTEAFTLLARAELPAEVRIALVEQLSVAAGYRGMVGGQAGDMGLGGPVRDLDSLMRVHKLKTGALIRAAVCMGGLVARASDAQQDLLSRYGDAVGLAFQLADDVLDAEQDAGDDGPPSYVRLLGVEETARRARALADEAVQLASQLPAPAALLALARYTVERSV